MRRSGVIAAALVVVVLLVATPVPQDALVDDFETDFWLPFTHFHLGDQASAGYSGVYAHTGFRSYHVEIHGWTVRDFGSAYGYALFSTRGAAVAEIRMAILYDALTDASPSVWDSYAAGVALELLGSDYTSLGSYRYITAYRASQNAGRCGPTLADVVLDDAPPLDEWQELGRNPAVDFPSAPWAQASYVKVSVGFLCAAGLTGASYSLYADDFSLETNSGDSDRDGVRDLEEETRIYSLELADVAGPRVLAPHEEVSVSLAGPAVSGSLVAGAVSLNLVHPTPDDLAISLVMNDGATPQGHLLWDPGVHARGLAILSPSSGQSMHAPMQVEGRIAPEVAGAWLHFLVDGTERDCAPRAEPGWFSFDWDTEAELEGTRLLRVVASDSAEAWEGGRASEDVPVVVDRTAPELRILSPSEGVAVSGSLKVEAAAFDVEGVVASEFWLDGQKVETLESEPFVFLYETLDLTNAVHTVEVRVRDAADNVARSSVSFVVANKANVPPPPCYPACNLTAGTTVGNLAPVRVQSRSFSIPLSPSTRLDVAEGLRVPWQPSVTRENDHIALVLDAFGTGGGDPTQGLVHPAIDSAAFLTSGNWTLVVRDYGDDGGFVEQASVRFAVRTDPQRADTDGDGLDDGAERAASTVPVLADMDADGLSDGFESQAHLIDLTINGVRMQRTIRTDPLNPDTDSDGLRDGDELFPGEGGNVTDPTVYDTDADDLSDGEERHIYGTDPTRSDMDGDTLPDGFEVRPHDLVLLLNGTVQVRSVVTSPFLADTDMDGLQDADEWHGAVVFGVRTDPSDPDTDSDGLSDGDELAGVNRRPTNPADADTDRDGLTDGVDLSPTEVWGLSWKNTFEPGLVRFRQRYHGLDVHPFSAEIWGMNRTGACVGVSNETLTAERNSDDTPAHALATVNDLFLQAGEFNLTAIAAGNGEAVGWSHPARYYGLCSVTAPLQYRITYLSEEHLYDIDFVNNRTYTVRDEAGAAFSHATLEVPITAARSQSILLQFTLPAAADRATEDGTTVPGVFYSLHSGSDYLAAPPFYQNFAVGTPVSDHAYEFNLRVPKDAARAENLLAGPRGPVALLDVTPMWFTSTVLGVRRSALDVFDLRVGAVLTRVQESAELLVTKCDVDMVALMDALPASGEGVARGIHTYGRYNVYVSYPAYPLDPLLVDLLDAVWMIGESEEEVSALWSGLPAAPNRVWSRSSTDGFGTAMGVMKVLRRGITLTSQVTGGMMAPLIAMPPGGMEQMSFGGTALTVTKLEDSLSGDAYYVIGRTTTQVGKSHYPHPELPDVILTDTQHLEENVASEIVDDLGDSRLLTGVKYSQLKLGLQRAAIGATVAIFGSQAVLAYRDGDVIRGTVYASAGSVGVLGIVKGDHVLIRHVFQGHSVGMETKIRTGVVAAIAVGGILAAYEVFLAGQAQDPIRKLSHYESGTAIMVDTIVGVVPVYGAAAMLGWQLGLGIAVAAQLSLGAVPNPLALRIVSSPGSAIAFLIEYAFASEIPSLIAEDALVSILTSLSINATYNNNLNPPKPTILLVP